MHTSLGVNGCFHSSCVESRGWNCCVGQPSLALRGTALLFQSGCHILYPQRRYLRAPISPLPPNTCYHLRCPRQCSFIHLSDAGAGWGSEKGSKELKRWMLELRRTDFSNKSRNRKTDFPPKRFFRASLRRPVPGREWVTVHTWEALLGHPRW